jgi:hypothetical protein
MASSGSGARRDRPALVRGEDGQPDALTAAEQSFERLAAAQLASADVGRRRVFGRGGLTVHGRFFAFLDGDQLLVKVLPSTANALVARGEACTTESVSPTMTRWIAVPFASRPARWQALITEARQYTAGELRAG